MMDFSFTIHLSSNPCATESLSVGHCHLTLSILQPFLESALVLDPVISNGIEILVAVFVAGFWWPRCCAVFPSLSLFFIIVEIPLVSDQRTLPEENSSGSRSQVIMVRPNICPFSPCFIVEDLIHFSFYTSALELVMTPFSLYRLTVRSVDFTFAVNKAVAPFSFESFPVC